MKKIIALVAILASAQASAWWGDSSNGYTDGRGNGYGYGDSQAYGNGNGRCTSLGGCSIDETIRRNLQAFG